MVLSGENFPRHMEENFKLPHLFLCKTTKSERPHPPTETSSSQEVQEKETEYVETRENSDSDEDEGVSNSSSASEPVFTTPSGPEISDDFISSIWSSRLPTNIQVIIASQPKSSLDSLASLADAVTDVMCQPQINHVASPHDELKELRNCVAELTKQVAALSTSTSRRPRSRSGQRAYESRRRSHSHGRSRDASTSGVCWYHRTFKENATKCRAPCSYKGNDNSSH
ncbi:unnamed protein product [Pieris brassicae]|uniref:Uncharacterized protein n=1 Tax=Pieris brassicae TaxID=7116 RepID=A0A9P0TCF5_PIEBR|nr:unnamed protein product [Pieris brassicae]